MKRTFSKIKDVDKLILSNLDDKDLLTTCLTNKYVLSLCDEDFFRNRVEQLYPNTIAYKRGSWKNHYLKIVYYKDKLKDLGFEFTKNTNGNIGRVYRVISDNIKDATLGLEAAAGSGYLDVVQFFEKRGADFFTQAALLAIHGDHDDVAKYLINSKSDRVNLNQLLNEAAFKGRKDIVDLLISKGAYNWNWGIMGAEQGGHHDLVKFFKSKIEQ